MILDQMTIEEFWIAIPRLLNLLISLIVGFGSLSVIFIALFVYFVYFRNRD